MYSTHGQQRALLNVIQCATELRWHLADVLTAYARDETGVQQARIVRIAQLLQDGVPLADAVDQVPYVITEPARLAIRVGSQSGTLPQMLSEVADESPQSRESRISMRQGTVYLILVSGVIAIIWTFQVVKIVPVFRAIAAESGVTVNGATWTTNVSQWLGHFWPIVALLFATLIWFVATGRFHQSLSRGRLAPFVGRTLRLRSAELLRLLGIVKQAGRPLPASISSMAKFHFDPAIRHRLLYVRNELEQGSNVWTALRRVGLLSTSESQLLDSADRVGNTPWALGLVAQQKMRVASRRFAIAVELIRVAIILLLGGIVLSLALGTFSFLAAMSQATA